MRDAELRIRDQSVASRAVPPHRQLGRLTAGLFSAEDLLLGLQTFHREVRQADTHVVEVRDDLLLGALHLEVGERRLGRTVEVVVGQTLTVQRQMLDQVREPRTAERFVGDPHAEDQPGAYRARVVGEENGDAVDLGVVDGLAHDSTLGECGGAVPGVGGGRVAEVAPRVPGGQVPQSTEVDGGPRQVADQREHRSERALHSDPSERAREGGVQYGAFRGLYELLMDVRQAQVLDPLVLVP